MLGPEHGVSRGPHYNPRYENKRIRIYPAPGEQQVMPITIAIAPQDLLALMLAVAADRSIKQPPRYLSWLLQRWQARPDAPPVDGWERWQRLAALPVGEWATTGSDEWARLVPDGIAALPFGLEEIVRGDPSLDAPPPDPQPRPAIPSAESVADPASLETRVSDGALTIAELWRVVMGQLSMKLHGSIYTNWVQGARPVAYADGVLTVWVRHRTARDQLAQRFNGVVEATVEQFARQPIRVRYVV